MGSIIIAIILLGIIILVHEAGHFVFAKMFKVPVREFSLGMGKRLFSFVRGNTRYSLKVLPIGGSCAMIGEDPAGSGDMIDVDGKIDHEKNTIDFEGVVYDLDYVKKYNYGAIHPLKKMLICFGGPLFNFLLALILAMVMVTFTGIDIPSINSVNIDSPVAVADPIPLKKGDIITSIQLPNEKEKHVNLTRDLSLYMFIHSDDIVKYEMPIKIGFLRDGKKYETALMPRYDEKMGKAIIGITLDAYKKVENIFQHIEYGFKEFYFYIDSTIMSLKMLIRGKMQITEVSGPVGTVAVMGSSIKSASSVNMLSTVLTIFSLVVLISANLGVMNLLPIPALDGGRIIFAFVELIIGRRINPKIETFLNVFTMILLLVFMAWVFGLDILKLLGK